MYQAHKLIQLHMRVAACALAILLLGTSSALAQSLPPQVQADMLAGEIVGAYAEGPERWADVLASIERYHKLASSSDVKIPPGILFLEAKLSSDSDPARAKRALTLYFQTASKTDPKYNEALRLYPVIEQRAATAEAAKSEKELEAARVARQAAEEKRRAEIVARIPDMLREIESNMIAVPAGRFKMGVTPRKGGTEDKASGPEHLVQIKAFKISKLEVTLKQWQLFQASNGLPIDGTKEEFLDYAATNVSWDDAQAFVQWLNRKSGRQYRLPSEAEWEYAARAATTTNYPWGDRFDDFKAWGRTVYVDDASPSYSGDGKVKYAGLLLSGCNRWRLCDVIGNAAKWVEDCWHDRYDGAPADGSAWISSMDCNERVIRGGSAGDVFVSTHHNRALGLVSGKQDIHITVWTRKKGAGKSPQVGFRLAES